MKYALISSYGTIPTLSTTDPKLQVLDISRLYDINKALFRVSFDPERCNYRTLNTRDVCGHDNELDLLCYEYEPLPETGWIRLLDFLIEEREGVRVIVGTLIHRSFEAAERLGYHALSYAWGKPYRTHHLMCDDGKIPITWNLRNWLTCLSRGTYVFWIDAVCINQRDKTERGHQVSQMREVYRRANRVYAFLGSVPAADDHFQRHQAQQSDTFKESMDDIRALEVLHGMSVDFFYHRSLLSLSTRTSLDLKWRLIFFWNYIRVQVEILRGISLGIYDIVRSYILYSPGNILSWRHYMWHYTIRRWAQKIKVHPLDVMLRRPYFNRRWVVQELASTKPGDGKLFYKWDRLEFPSETLNSIGGSFHWAVTGNAFQQFQLETSNAMEHEFNGLNTFQLLHEMRTTGHSSLDAGIRFLELSNRLFRFSCSDQRDKLYALIGLYPDLDFKVDYSKTVGEVYKSFATHLISTRPQCLPALLNCAVLFSGQNDFWPSWVPDWRYRIDQSQTTWDPTEKLSRSGPLVHGGLVDITALDEHDPSRVRVGGFYVGYVISASIDVTHPDGPTYYLLVTANGHLACIFVVELAFYPLKGDLVFDLGKLYFVRPFSSKDRIGRLLGVTHADKLWTAETLVHNDNNPNDAAIDTCGGLPGATASASEDPYDFTNICNQVYAGLGQLLRPDDLARKAEHLHRLLSAPEGRKSFGNNPEPRVRGQETVFFLT